MTPNRQQRPDGRTPTYRVLAGVLKALVLVPFTKPVWRGAENLPRTGGVIVAANHITQVDPLTTAHFLYNQRRAPKILAKDSLWRVPVLGWCLRATDMIPVARGTRQAADSLVAAGQSLAQGQCVLIFPEGTLTKDPQAWPMRGHLGVARLALQHRVPVIPLGQWGAQALLSRSGKVNLRPRHRVVVEVGPAVDLSDLYGKAGDQKALVEATERIMAAITGIVAGIRGEQPPATVFDPKAARQAPSADSAPAVTAELDATAHDGGEEVAQ